MERPGENGSTPFTNQTKAQRIEQIRWILTLILLALISGVLIWMALPFLLATTWAAALVLATWPIYRLLCTFIQKRRNVTAMLMTTFLALILVGALLPVIIAVSQEAHRVTDALNTFVNKGLPALPDRVAGIRIAGVQIDEAFEELQITRERVIETMTGYSHSALGYVRIAFASVLASILQILLVLFISFFFYRDGNFIANQVIFAVRGIGGDHAVELLQQVQVTVKSAVYGIVATAVSQGLFAGVGYLAAGTPYPVLLGFATMVLSVVPFGPALVYMPLAAYMYYAGNVGTAIFIAAWGIGVVSIVDNVLRPFFISHGTRTPILLSFFSVLGGLLLFGLIGIIIGPAVVATAQTLWLEWVRAHEDKNPETMAVLVKDATNAEEPEPRIEPEPGGEEQEPLRKQANL